MQVDTSYKAALEARGTDNGRLGLRNGLSAFVVSPGGNNLEVVVYDHTE